MNDILVISPSGKLYGSERVLLDYIKHSMLSMDLAVPEKSDLLAEAKRANTRHGLLTYDPKSIKTFYVRLFFLLIKGKYKSVYINEAGHIKYIFLLARIFSSVKFIVHVRIIEDASPGRWTFKDHKMPSNIKVITISKYLSGFMNFQNTIVPDPFVFNNEFNRPKYNTHETFKIGIIGRVALSKGINLLPYLLKAMSDEKQQERFRIELFGEVSDDITAELKDIFNNNPAVKLHGYVRNNQQIYTSLHAIIHLNEKEPLGRIFFEAVNHGLPFIGINAGGIGEMANQFEYSELMVEPGENPAMAAEILRRMMMVIENYTYYLDLMQELKTKMDKQLSVTRYCQAVDQIVNTN